MLFNFYKGSTHKIYIYLKSKSKSEQYSILEEQIDENSIFLVHNSLYDDSSSYNPKQKNENIFIIILCLIYNITIKLYTK